MALLLVLIVAGGNSDTVDSDGTRVSSNTWAMEEDNKNRWHQVKAMRPLISALTLSTFAPVECLLSIFHSNSLF